jgi:hypothetical protein
LNVLKNHPRLRGVVGGLAARFLSSEDKQQAYRNSGERQDNSNLNDDSICH